MSSCGASALFAARIHPGGVLVSAPLGSFPVCPGRCDLFLVPRSYQRIRRAVSGLAGAVDRRAGRHSVRDVLCGERRLSFLVYDFWSQGMPWYLADSNRAGDYPGHIDYFQVLCWVTTILLLVIAYRQIQPNQSRADGMSEALSAWSRISAYKESWPWHWLASYLLARPCSRGFNLPPETCRPGGMKSPRSGPRSIWICRMCSTSAGAIPIPSESGGDRRSSIPDPRKPITTWQQATPPRAIGI